MATPATILRVVIASPSDVPKERKALCKVIEDVNKAIGRGLGLRLEPVMWEDALPGIHPEGPQGMVDQELRPEDADLFIGIFWNRFGTPVIDADSGTEHEYLKALKSHETTGSPKVMFYFNQQPISISNTDMLRQKQKVLDFQAKLPGLWCSYNGVTKFRSLVSQHLTKYLMEYNLTRKEGKRREPVGQLRHLLDKVGPRFWTGAKNTSRYAEVLVGLSIPVNYQIDAVKGVINYCRSNGVIKLTWDDFDRHIRRQDLRSRYSPQYEPLTMWKVLKGIEECIDTGLLEHDDEYFVIREGVPYFGF